MSASDTSIMLMLLASATHAAAPGPASAAIANLRFRPPAIPLITADPFMQTWIWGDNSTAASVRHWDGVAKDSLGMIMVDGVTFRYLGDCHSPRVTTPGPATAYPGENINPGQCDIGDTGNQGVDDCNERCYNNPACKGFVLDHDTCWLKDCTEPRTKDARSNSSVIYPASRPPCDVSVPAIVQRSVVVYPTRTIFELEVPGVVALTLTLLQSAFTDDQMRLSRPVYYVHHEVRSLDGQGHIIKLYTDFSAAHTVNDCEGQQVEWADLYDPRVHAIRMGSHAQDVLGSKGDRVNLDWGYLYLAAGESTAPASVLRAGSAKRARQDFVQTGTLPSTLDTRQPRTCADDLPALAIFVDLGIVGAGGSTSASQHTVLLAYDDVRSVYYFKKEYKGLWTQAYPDITAAIAAASSEVDAILAKSEQHDEVLLAKLQAVGGVEYSQLCALAYRQVLAALKPVWVDDRNVTWTFLKEISTNGDMNTMDVIYPASPMLLYTEPELLRQLLVPVLAYANNETFIRFGNPYSPHQLGTYPIANDSTAAQEPMPLENSGNMLFMLLALVQRSGALAAQGWLTPYMPMLRKWADELVRTSLFPADQLCTDDFTGRLPNNTNLGQKGIVAIRAYAELCSLMGVEGVDCKSYSATADRYATTWEQYAYSDEIAPHYMMSYNPVPGVTDSWSFKYNLLWQRLLKLAGPFDFDKIAKIETDYYLRNLKEYGVPMDPRHTYVKSDWLSWVAAMMPDDTGFHKLITALYRYYNETESRQPLTDLYDTVTAKQTYALSFIARPVMGGLYAKMLLSPKKSTAPVGVVERGHD